jgi:hypothetical protein
MNYCLQEEDWEIIGIDQLNTEKKELLYHFIGRNSHFQLKSENEISNTEDDAMFLAIIDKETKLNDLWNFCKDYAKKYFLLDINEYDEETLKEPNDNYFIQLPPLIGPWMNKNQYLQRIKREDSIFIEDFVQWFIYHIKHEKLPNKVQFNDDKRSIVSLQKTPREKWEKDMEYHLKKFAQIYEEIPL